jgi:hypothetical protein
VAVGKGDGIQLAEPIAAAKMVAELGILVTENAAVAELEMAGEEGADAELGGGADDGEGGRLDPNLAGAFPLAAAADGETLRPAEVFPIAGMDQLRPAVIRPGPRGVGIQESILRVFWRRPRNRSRRCKGRGRGFRSRTIPPRRKISGRPPKPAKKGRIR